MKTPFQLPLNTHRHAAFTTPLRLLMATTAALWMGAAHPQTPSTTVSRQVSDLRFREFFSPPTGSDGLEISDTLRQADGRVVRLVGYMVQEDNPAPGRLMLTSSPVSLKAQADGGLGDLPPATVTVYLDPSQQDWTVPHVRGLVTVNGLLRVHLHEQATQIHLQLDPETARSTNVFELTGYLHRLEQPRRLRKS